MLSTISFPRLAKNVFVDLSERSLGLPGTQGGLPQGRTEVLGGQSRGMRGHDGGQGPRLLGLPAEHLGTKPAFHWLPPFLTPRVLEVQPSL